MCILHIYIRLSRLRRATHSENTFHHRERRPDVGPLLKGSWWCSANSCMSNISTQYILAQIGSSFGTVVSDWSWRWGSSRRFSWTGLPVGSCVALGRESTRAPILSLPASSSSYGHQALFGTALGTSGRCVPSW